MGGLRLGLGGRDNAEVVAVGKLAVGKLVVGVIFAVRLGSPRFRAAVRAKVTGRVVLGWGQDWGARLDPSYIRVGGVRLGLGLDQSYS